METLGIALAGLATALAGWLATIVLVLSGAILMFFVLTVAVETMASWLPVMQRLPRAARRPSLAVVIPAHNEESGVAATITNIRSQLQDDDRLIVVADNCTDATAIRSSTAGAEVIERYDQSKRGKGYALDFAIRHLEQSPPEIVLFVDADCTLAPGSVEALVDHVVLSNRAVQAHVEQLPPTGNASVVLTIASFAFLVKNFVRPLGLRNLGLASPLHGTGMAFPWATIRSLTLASPEVVEDMIMGLELVSRGEGAQFCPQARVTTQFPVHQEGQQTQRLRWEAGHLKVLVHKLPSLIWQAIRTANHNLFAVAAHIAVPPLALLSLSLGVHAVLSTFAWLAFDHSLSGIIILTALVTFLLSIVSAWFHADRGVVPVSAFLMIPYYAVSKLGLYVRIFATQKLQWVRTRRD
jgi:cellulose synthase/poly-beta-1,6-N-acetylglucosamine synthase-like glycosyltransferase